MWLSSETRGGEIEFTFVEKSHSDMAKGMGGLMEGYRTGIIHTVGGIT